MQSALAPLPIPKTITSFALQSAFQTNQNALLVKCLVAKKGAGTAACFYTSLYLVTHFAGRGRKKRALLTVSILVPANKRHDSIGLWEGIVTVEIDTFS